MSLVRMLASGGSRGLALTDLSRASRLPHPTVHRLLQSLAGEGLVRQITGTRRYALGALAFEVGLAAAQQFDLQHLCRSHVARLAQEAGDTVYLVMRSGVEAVCVDRCEGPSPIRVMTLEIGSRRPLGMGAGGLAILAALDQAEMDDVVAHINDGPGGFGKLSIAELKRSVVAARQAGYSLISGRVTPGVTAVGVAFSDTLRRPIGAISIAAIAGRMDAPRVRALAAKLRSAAKAIEAELRGAIRR
jgi:DNA-binding IclR family transcriptional regulator